MAHDIARLILEYSLNPDPPEPEKIRDWLKTNYYNLHQHPDWKHRLRTMVHRYNTHIIMRGYTIEENLEKCGQAPAYTWGKIKYDLDTNYSDFGIEIADETDLDMSVFHLNPSNTICISDLNQLSDTEKKYTTIFTCGWLYFPPGTKIREFLDYVFRFGLVPQLHQWQQTTEKKNPHVR